MPSFIRENRKLKGHFHRAVRMMPPLVKGLSPKHECLRSDPSTKVKSQVQLCVPVILAVRMQRGRRSIETSCLEGLAESVSSRLSKRSCLKSKVERA